MAPVITCNTVIRSLSNINANTVTNTGDDWYIELESDKGIIRYAMYSVISDSVPVIHRKPKSKRLPDCPKKGYFLYIVIMKYGIN